jgi:uncharacterized protein with ParB-like and HNH nuclease domain
MSKAVTTITIERKSLAALLRAVDEKRFTIPKLQREFVWDGPKAAKLVDSIVRGMPIRTGIVWEAPRSQRLHLRQKCHDSRRYRRDSARLATTG